jgi:hypothetical protein
MSLTTCPPEILKSIIDFLREAETGPCNPDLINLRLVNREFSCLLQPLVYESICIPPAARDWPSVTNDARQLLRLIDRNPSLATCIRDFEYYDPDVDQLPLDDYYDEEELKHDHKIFSQFAEELAQKSSTAKKFGYSSEPSQLRKMSVVYDQACIPILLSRLPNLRSFTFNGRVGGKYSFLFTLWAKAIWEWMPPKSLEVLNWHPKPKEEDNYCESEESGLDEYDDNSVENQPKQPTNVWDAVSFLRLTPMLQHLSIIDDYFLDEATLKNIPVLQFLTVIEFATEEFYDIWPWMLELLKCTPMLKKIKCTNIGARYLDAPSFKEVLRLVRNTIEEIEFYGAFEDTSNTGGGIGPFMDFPNLRKISTDVESLIPRPGNSPENFSLLELLPPNLESLHLTDAIGFMSEYRPFGTVNPFPNTNWNPEPMSTFYKLLEDVALAKERGPLKKLTSMSMEFGWRSQLPISEEDTKGVAAICKSLGIEWKHSVDKLIKKRWKKQERNVCLRSPKWYEGWLR